MQSSPDKHQGVKAIQINRARIKERIQEKHRQQSQQVRQSRLSGLREADDDNDRNVDEQEGQQFRGQWTASAHATASPTGMLPTLTSSCTPASSGLCFGPDGTVMMPVVQDWSDIGHEFGVNILDADVMECLLALEEEIRQEQLFSFYDQTNGNEWEEYYNSLNS